MFYKNKLQLKLAHISSVTPKQFPKAAIYVDCLKCSMNDYGVKKTNETLLLLSWDL